MSNFGFTPPKKINHLAYLCFISINFIYIYIFSLPSTSPAHKYYLAMDPVGEVLYVSDTSSRRVYRVRNLVQPKDPARNLEVVAGTGEQCLPFDQSHCGEGRKATEAALNNPRGKDNVLIAAEGALSLGLDMLCCCHERELHLFSLQAGLTNLWSAVKRSAFGKSRYA